MKNYLSLVKFSHTVFALPFAMIGFTLGIYYFFALYKLANPFDAFQPAFLLNTYAKYPLPFFIIYKLVFVLICMVTARNAAMAFNRYIDRKYDEKNPRTAIREIPAGIITSKNAMIFIVINCILFVVATYCINTLCFYLSPIALSVILGYSLTKRFTFLCHLILGVGLGLAPIGAFLAVTGKFEILPLFFSFAVLFWVAGFDIIYALQDEQFDKENKLYSIPSYFGQDKAKWIARLLHVASILCLFGAGIYGNFVFTYWLGFAVFVALLFYQHFLVLQYGLEKIDLAFFTTNGIASILFSLCVITEIIMHI
ncbi:MAG: 4-hydroxybenzoate octaprenyltransferase [Bacteroidia bacterium]|nr:MAG: 4-hydroxybenzoate octaprenyltransferase [Bacteroidia bacterium]